MAKIITDVELVDIVNRVVLDEFIIDDAGTYAQFLRDLAGLLTDYLGGIVGGVGSPTDTGGPGLGWTVAIHYNESIPADGGVWKNYDGEGY